MRELDFPVRLMVAHDELNSFQRTKGNETFYVLY